MSKKYVYHFSEAYGKGKELLGGKGAGLAEMTHIGVPIPQGFTISTEACTLYYDSGKKYTITIETHLDKKKYIFAKGYPLYCPHCGRKMSSFNKPRYW